MRKRAVLFVLIGLLVAGCTSIGPKSVPRDRFDYNQAISDSWKEQTLLNIVKLRYADMPLFVEVASIVSGYTLERSVNLGAKVFDGGSAAEFGTTNSATIGGSGKYTDRPTITYAPITGSNFNKTFMTPIPPSAVMFMLQAGWPAELVLPITVEAINGQRAQRSVGMRERSGDESFYRIVELFGVLQRGGAMGMRVTRKDSVQDSTVIVIRSENVPAEISAAAAELAGLLGIRRDAAEYTISFGEVARNDTELAMLTRSTLAIMVELSGQVRAPAAHVEEGRTNPSLDDGNSADTDQRRLIDIRSGTDLPADAFVTVKYREHWFWIDDRDFRSKRVFAYLMLLFSLTESGGKEGLPLVTIPAG
ncbi:MAG: hypothetical protein WBO58_04805 [Gammaproteobacteria bacterium]